MNARGLRLWSLLPVVGLIIALASGCANTVRVQGESMAPTIKDGERLTVDRKAFASAGPQRSDIVLFEYEGGNRIGRVIGLPGETIGIEGGLVYVDGTKLDEPYLASGTRTQSATDTFQVPQDSYFVMGDNRERSNDSRVIGPIPRAQIIAKVVR